MTVEAYGCELELFLILSQKTDDFFFFLFIQQ